MGYLMVILLVLLLALLAAGHDISPLVCMTELTIKLVAGQSNVFTLVENPFGRRYEAVLRFIDAAAEPITYGFDANPCLGVQVATFQIPLGVPNGYTYFIWQCRR
ncbi:hypothetical protein NKR23_g12340 [Pleurostoma richardsiae]|uniref:Uncharacterized protein n=1 Tax=Pleurostoma richardsiae TaxID=41990 RepID=A0AA38VCW4_9PEZI|nr:hypothetical protein NKR23_g12340 [Pleurostoma richardsiae]